MQKRVSRRKFFKQAAAASGAILLPASVSGASNAAPGTGQPYRPSRAEIMQNEEAQADYDNIVLQPVYNMSLTPHWFGDDTRFWYSRDLSPDRREFIIVDAATGARRLAFDHARLAAALSAATGQTYSSDHLPFDTIEFAPAERAVSFATGDTAWTCDLDTYALVSAPKSPPKHNQEETTPDQGQDTRDGAAASPDRKWTAFVHEFNIFVRATAGGQDIPLTHDGRAEQPYGAISWSPDSQAFIAYQISPVPIKPCFLIESSPHNGSTRGVLHQHEYAQAGDPCTAYDMWIFDPVRAAATKAQTETIDFGDTPDLRWDNDCRRFTFERMDRGYQRFRVIGVDVKTGQSIILVDDRAKTFIDSTTTYVHYTKSGDEILYASEQDGWRHLYLFDGRTGALKNRVTQGSWVVRDVHTVDEKERQIWFAANGRNHGEDPYHLHYYRVDFDGSALTALTGGDGSHTVQHSPDRRWLIDTYSRADLPPIHTLRRTVDGAHVCDLEQADISALTGKGWRPPEVFHAKGRDGDTDIWGLVFRPRHLSAARKYPVIENIYAGPQDSFVCKTFAVQDSMQSLAELGFIVVQCDGMGTRNRSKAFHDVCWHNLKDAGFPDRIAWIKALAARHPFTDTERVGIYGTSAGGQNSTGALLFHPEFYKAAVSSCGCHDNRIDKQWWNEQWMGYPVGPWYADNSNITHAPNLRGKLMLMVGELDTNVPPESTLRLADALMKAGKDFDLVIITGSDHTGGGTYGERRRRDFFVRHLLGGEPPDRNIPRPHQKPVILEPYPLTRVNQAQAVGGNETTIEFRNRTHHAVNLFWLSGGGVQTSYGQVPAEGTRQMHTYAGHWWLVCDPDNQPIALFVGEDRPGIAEVR